jgi:transposase
MLLSEGQMSDYKGAALMIDALPPAKQLRGDKGYDANWFRQALAARGITACIPSKSNRAKPIEHDRMLYRQRHKIENTFGRLKGGALSCLCQAVLPVFELSPGACSRFFTR